MATANVTLRTTADIAAISRMDAAFQDLSKAEQKAAQQAIATAQAFARLDAATGNPTQGAARLRATLDGLGAGPARQVAGVEAQIARLGNTTQQTTGLASQFGSAFKSQLLGIVGPAALAGIAIGSVGKAIEASGKALSLRETQNSLKAIAGDAQTYANTLAIARKQQILFGGTLEENIQGLTGLTITSKQSGAALETLIDLSQRLGTLDPAQGTAGARVALSEALSGDTTSLAKRYEIPRKELEKLRDTTVPVAERLKIIDSYLNKVGITSEAVAGRVDKTAEAYRRLGAAAEGIILGAAGRSADNTAAQAGALADLTRAAEGTSQGVASAATAIITLQNTLRGLAPPSEAATTANNKLAESILRFIGLNAEQPINKYADANERGGLAAERATTTSTALAGAVAKELQEKVTAQVATGNLARLQAQLASDSALAANGLLGAGDQAVILAQKYGIAIGEAQNLINAQQALGNATALADQRKGEQAGTTKSATQFNIEARLARDKAQRDAIANAPINAAAIADQRIGERTGTTQTAKQFNAISELERKAAQQKVAEQKRAADQAANDARRIADAQFQYNLTKATSNAQKIGVVRSQLAKTTDPAERLNLESQILNLQQASGRAGVSAASRQTTELQKQLSLNERIYDSVNKQNIAKIDVQLAQLDDEKKRLDEANQIRAAQNIVNDPGFSEDFKARARLVLERTPLEQQKRQLEIAEQAATAGGAIVNGRILQSQAGGPISIPAPGGAAPAGATTAATGGAEQAGVINIDGKQVGIVLLPHLLAALRSGRAQVAAAGG